LLAKRGKDEVQNGWRVIEAIACPNLLEAKTLAFEATIYEVLCAAIEALEGLDKRRRT